MKGFLVAGTVSGVGKTTVALGMAAPDAARSFVAAALAQRSAEVITR